MSPVGRRVVGVFGALLGILLLVSPSGAGAGGDLLWDNGGLISSIGTGLGGADESVLQDVTLGLESFGFSHAGGLADRVAEDFVVSDSRGWLVDRVAFLSYQEGSGPASTVAEVNLRIWSGDPRDAGSVVVFGDPTTDRLASTAFAGIYRTAESGSPTDGSRPIVRSEVAVEPPLLLGPGEYWIDWQTLGNPQLSGPWAPPVTESGQESTGNALQSLDGGASWSPVLDSGLGTPQGLPFEIRGTFGTTLAAVVEVPALGRVGSGLLVLLLILAGWRSAAWPRPASFSSSPSSGPPIQGPR